MDLGCLKYFYMSGGLAGGLTSNCYKFLTILHNADSHLNFYEAIKTEIRSISFESQRKSREFLPLNLCHL